MTKITAIGLGLMGSGIARALLSKGNDLTVWNRDASKATAIVEAGAAFAGDIQTAINASELIVICVSDYKATRQILDGVLLPGKTIIQLSTGTPKEARDFDAWVTQQGGASLNGDILAWPRQIGTSEATITVSGNELVFNAHKSALEALGKIEHAGDEPGASAVLFNAVMAYLAGNWIGFCHGALICEHEGMRTDTFGQLIAGISPMLAGESIHMGEVIQNGRFANPESTVNTTANDLHLLVQHSREVGISADLPVFAANLFQRAADAGYGGEEHAAIIKVLRQGGQELTGTR